MKEVYRLEHKSIKLDKTLDAYASPYHIQEAISENGYTDKYGFIVAKLIKKHATLDRPGWFADFKKNELAQVCVFTLSACPTLNALKDWFSCCYDDLLELGFVIRKYTVKEYILSKSKKQCIFQDFNIIKKQVI